MDEAEPRRANAGDKETGKSDPTIFKLDLIRDGIYTSSVDSSSPPPPPTTARLPEARTTANRRGNTKSPPVAALNCNTLEEARRSAKKKNWIIGKPIGLSVGQFFPGPIK
jgi:hypothetical protein